MKFIDIHVHAEPDIYKRRYTVKSLGHELRTQNCAAVVKSHLGATTALACGARKEGLPILGSVTLNRYAGGIQRSVVEAAAAVNGSDAPMVIWFPTLTGYGCKPKVEQLKYHPILNSPIAEERVSTDGRLKPEVIDIMKLAVEYGYPLATGHASREEVFLLADAAHRYGARLMMTHPTHPSSGLSMKDIVELHRCGNIWVKVCILMLQLGYMKLEQVWQLFRLLDMERVCVSSDFGQVHNSSVKDAYVSFADSFKRVAVAVGEDHLDEALLYKIFYINPSAYLGWKLPELPKHSLAQATGDFD